jgi:hypothetical protein
MDLYNDEFLKLVSTFEKHCVKYLVIGGFAVNRYGYNRTTGDVDFYLKDSLDNRKNLINALDDMGYGRFDVLETTPIMAGYCEIVMDNGMYADLMTEIPGLSKEDFDEQYKVASTHNLKGITIRFIHLSHLLQNKAATGRTKDLLDIEELTKINRGTG